MPGRRHREQERSITIQLRVTKAEAARWREHVRASRGYVSAMVRQLVNDHLDNPRITPCRGHRY